MSTPEAICELRSNEEIIRAKVTHFLLRLFISFHISRNVRSLYDSPRKLCSALLHVQR